MIAPPQGGGGIFQPAQPGPICCRFLHGPGKKGVPAGVVYKVTIDMFPNVPKGNIVGDFAPTDYEVALDCFRFSRETHIPRSLSAPHVITLRILQSRKK